MKIIKNNFLFAAILILTLGLVSCEEDVTSDTAVQDYNYISLEGPFSKLLSLYPDESTTVSANVHASQTSNVDRTYPLVVDPTSTLGAGYYTVPATVTIPAGETMGTFTVQVTGTDIGQGKNLIVKLGQQEGLDVSVGYTEVGVLDPETGAQINYVDVVNTPKLTINIEEKCDFNKCVLTIKFDNYPEETAWELYDASFNVIASGGLDATGTTITGYAALGFADQSTFITNFCLEAGDYTFVIYDDYGDGMYTSASVQGNYSLKYGTTVLASGGGNFGSFQDTAFTLQ